MRVLDLAPHCSFPPMDGADKRAWHLYEGLVQSGASGRFVGRKVVIEQLASPVTHSGDHRWRDGKLTPALLSLLLGCDYWQFKMLTPGVLAAAAASAASDFDTILVNFLYSTPLLRVFRGRRVRLVVDTHNYDPAVFEGFRAATRNPLTRRLCRRAIRTSHRALAELPSGTVLVHVSEEDATAYRKDRPDLTHIVVENGCRVRPRTTAPDYHSREPKQLLFVGSLSAQMNQDALRHFAERYWPHLRDVTRMCVAGSNPPPAIAALCTAQGWELRPNVTEDELDACYATAHFAVLPFAYGAGSKLKMMEACGRGVPALATPAGVTGINPIPPLVQVSEDPALWRKRVQEGGPPTDEALQQTQNFTNQRSWPHLGAQLERTLADCPVATNLE